MTNSRRIALFVLSLSILLISVVVFRYFQATAERSRLNSYIDIVINNYKEEKALYIDLAGVNYFPWDTVYIFGSYSNCKEIIKRLDAPYFLFECSLSGIEDYESLLLFVFKRNGRIVKSTIYFGASISKNNQDGYLYKDARFIFDEKGRMIWAGN